MSKLYGVLAVMLFGGSCFAQDNGGSPGWVVLPIHDYAALRTKAFPPPERTAQAPVQATLTRIDYDLRIEGAVASGRASLTVDVLKDGWVRIPIPQGLLVRDARLGSERLSLVPTPENPKQLSAVLSQRGRSILLLDVAFTVSTAGAEERLSLPVGASGVTRSIVSLAPQDLDVTVTGGYMAEKSAGRWLAYAQGSRPLTFAWRKKIEERRVELPARLRTSLTQLFGLGEDATSLNAEVTVEMMQGAATQLKIAVPDTVTINQVPGANVGDWDVRNGNLVVSFLDPVEATTKFAISAEARLPREGHITIPLLRVLDTERETGGAAVGVLGAGEIKDARTQGLDTADAAELGTLVAARQSPSMAAFRLRSGAADRSLELDVARYDQQAVLTANIEEARYRVLLTVDGKTLVQARYAVRNNQRNFAGITLPAGAKIWSSSLAGRPVRPGQAADGSLLFPLAKSRAGDEAPPFAVEMIYSISGAAWDSEGLSTLSLPVLDLPVSRTGLVLYFPPGFRLSPRPGAFRVQEYEAPASPVLNGTAADTPGETSPMTVSGSPSSAQALVDRYRAANSARKTAERLPLKVSFPTIGPSAFLVSELTGERLGASIEIEYHKDKKGGVR